MTPQVAEALSWGVVCSPAQERVAAGLPEGWSHDVDEVIGTHRLGYFLQLVPGWIQLTAEFRHPSWHCEEVSRIF